MLILEEEGYFPSGDPGGVATGEEAFASGSTLGFPCKRIWFKVVKAINRYSSGISRFLKINDPKYTLTSSRHIFALRPTWRILLLVSDVGFPSTPDGDVVELNFPGGDWGGPDEPTEAPRACVVRSLLDPKYINLL